MFTNSKRYHKPLRGGKIQQWDSDAVRNFESERTFLFNTIGEKERSVQIRNLPWCIYTSVCLTGADRKYIRVKETDSVKLDKKKASVFFALMYFLSAPARQTEV